jgi:hypothetical protein
MLSAVLENDLLCKGYEVGSGVEDVKASFTG